jgi:hypothetical protein
MIKNHYFIRFIPGAGGVHLSNLISLDATFNSKEIRLSKDQYIKYLLTYYSSHPTKAHLKNHYIISNRDLWLTYLNQQDFNLPNAVHVGHAASFYWVSDILETLKNKKFISLTFNTDRSIEILTNRGIEIDIAWGGLFQNNPYMRQELSHFYQTEFISTDPTISNDDINLQIEVEDLFNKNISFLIDKINKKFNLDIPLELAQNLHDLWIN